MNALILVLVAIFASVFQGVNTLLTKVSSHCSALLGNFMPGEGGTSWKWLRYAWPSFVYCPL